MGESHGSEAMGEARDNEVVGELRGNEVVGELCVNEAAGEACEEMAATAGPLDIPLDQITDIPDYGNDANLGQLMWTLFDDLPSKIGTPQSRVQTSRATADPSGEGDALGDSRGEATLIEVEDDSEEEDADIVAEQVEETLAEEVPETEVDLEVEGASEAEEIPQAEEDTQEEEAPQTSEVPQVEEYATDLEETSSDSDAHEKITANSEEAAVVNQTRAYVGHSKSTWPL